MPANHFETAVATAKATAGEVTTAFMLREARRYVPPKKLSKADKARMEGLEAAQARGASMLGSYARLLLQALRVQKSFSREERELLAEVAGAMHEKGL